MKKSKIVIAIVSCVFLCFLAGSASAEMRAGAVGVSPMIGGYVFEGNQDLDNDFAYGLGLGYNLTERWAIEATLNYIDTESDVGARDDTDVSLGRLDALYHFNTTGCFVPYLAAGVGGIYFDPDRTSSDEDALVNYGAGVKYFLTKDIALRGDVRHVISFDSTNHNLLYTVGLTFFFGGEKEAVAAPAPAPAPKPEPKPAPAPAPKPAPGPKDSDDDGVYDDADECPDTPAGARVDARGCWVIEGVFFDFDKSIIKPEGLPIIDEVATVLNSNPSMRVDIEGHTDSVGSDEWNQGLSERRARAVKDSLVSSGIESTRLTTKGFGESVPAATNKTKEGRAMNRRVELKPLQ